MDQQVISKELIEAYDLSMGRVKSAHQGRMENERDYWVELYTIKRDELWRAKFELFKDWLGEFSTEPFGESISTYYAVMGTIDRMLQNGVTWKTVQLYLGNRKVALEGDLQKWFEDNGKGALKPEVQKQLEDGGENLNQFVRRVASLPSGEARKETNRFTEKDKIYATDDQALWDEETGTLLFNCAWENEDDGLIWRGTITLTGTRIMGNGKKKAGSVLPSRVAEWAKSRLGVRG